MSNAVASVGPSAGSYVVLAGGVGAARFLDGLVRAVPPADVTAIVNVGDDMVWCGLHISPDLDTVVYTLSGQVNPETGWGLPDESYVALERLRELGGPDWFTIGDRDPRSASRAQRAARGRRPLERSHGVDRASVRARMYPSAR